jgi:hypothetical protein
MNEKIKQLAEQAEFYYNPANQGTAEQLEKFARLIVRECIDYCGENLSKTVGGALKIHFGVEE